VILRKAKKPGGNPPGFAYIRGCGSRRCIPMLLFILLPFMLLLLGPALLQIAQLLL
jgi:hypothetical protein